MIKTPKLPLIKLMGSTMLLSLPLLSNTVVAEEFLCDATQASASELPVLDASCPIGKGLWGTTPKTKQSQFWIQCGLFSKPISLTKGKRLYKHISTDVWMKPEMKGYRCLIGPYSDFAQAQQDLSRVRTENGYKEAFIREVSPRKTLQAAPVKQVTKPKPVQVAEKVTKPAPAVVPVPARPASEPEMRNTTKLAQPTVVSKPKSEQPIDIDIRLSATISGVEFKVPYVLFGNDQFYMEHEKPWNRMSYEEASTTCSQLGMRLASTSEWKTLLDSKVMVNKKWPMHLPYWGIDSMGLFTSGKVNQLKGTSLLNVMCVK